MATKTKKTFEYLLESGQNQYKTLLGKVEKLHDLNVLIKQYLPSPLVNHCQVANLRHGKLVLSVDSPVWATKLRFYMPELLAALRQQPRFAGLAGMDVCVAPEPLPMAVAPKITLPVRKISDSNRRMLLELATSIKDERLKAALMALASAKSTICA